MEGSQRQTGKRAKERIGLRRFPLLLLGISVPVILTLIAATVFLLPQLRTRAADVNMDCSLIVPANPLTAQGLATPYQLVATNAANGVCNEATANQAAFVQGAILDPATSKISIYNPLVIDQGTTPAVAPTAPQLPANAIIGLWFGSNGNTLTLQDSNGSLRQGRCVNGLRGSLFGQYAYCNAPIFFAAANQAIRAGRLKVPAIGMANDGLPCPTVRDFALVDMDQSDNVTTTYLVAGDGTTAQMTAANAAALQNSQPHSNGSDNRLLAIALDGALGCTPWQAPDLADNGNMVPALPLNELQAAAQQAAPVALVPLGDPMVLNNGQASLFKLNLYRLGVDQPLAFSPNRASTTDYCNNLLNIAPARILKDKATTSARSSPDAGAANSLFTFLAQRFQASFDTGGLACTTLLKVQNPIAVTTDANGVATDATITLPGAGGAGGGGGGGGGGNVAIDCAVNGVVVPGCNGTTTINNQTCAIMLDAAATKPQVNITCPAK